MRYVRSGGGLATAPKIDTVGLCVSNVYMYSGWNANCLEKDLTPSK